MSRQVKTNNQKKSPADLKKKFCKVCFDAGKEESLYTNHYVRETPEPTSKVVCPTLLQAKCGYCHELGHTPSRCKLLKTHQKEKMRQEIEAKRASEALMAKDKKIEKKISSKGFAALQYSSDEEEDMQVCLPAKETIAFPTPKEAYKNDFPELKPTTKSNVAAKAPAKSNLVSSLKQMCPGLEVGTKMPEVNFYKPQVAKLVRQPRKLTPQEEEDQFVNNYISEKLKTDPKYQKQQKTLNKELAMTTKYHQSHYGDDDLLMEQAYMCNSSGYDVTALHAEAIQAYKVSKFASNIDWTAEESESESECDLLSDDEDW